jgi:hypothetical protein
MVVLQGGGMIIFREEGVAYVHVPKTSGTKMRKVLRSEFRRCESWWGIVETPAGSPESMRFDKVDMAHWTAEMIREFRPSLWEELGGMVTFSVARDPYARSVSAYEQFLRHFGLGTGGVRCFSDYLDRVGDESYRRCRDGYLYIHGVPQTHFYLPGHRLMFGEDLSSPLSLAFGRRVVFGSSQRPVRPLSDAERDIVDRVYKDDIRMWRSLLEASRRPAA